MSLNLKCIGISINHLQLLTSSPYPSRSHVECAYPLMAALLYWVKNLPLDTFPHFLCLLWKSTQACNKDRVDGAFASTSLTSISREKLLTCNIGSGLSQNSSLLFNRSTWFSFVHLLQNYRTSACLLIFLFSIACLATVLKQSLSQAASNLLILVQGEHVPCSLIPFIRTYTFEHSVLCSQHRHYTYSNSWWCSRNHFL